MRCFLADDKVKRGSALIKKSSLQFPSLDPRLGESAGSPLGLLPPLSLSSYMRALSALYRSVESDMTVGAASVTGFREATRFMVSSLS